MAAIKATSPPIQLPSFTESNKVEASCAIAREKLELGDYEAGSAALQPWWRMGQWPTQSGLTSEASAQLLLAAGMLSGWIASTKQVLGGQKPAEGLLNGAIALFEQMGN